MLKKRRIYGLGIWSLGLGYFLFYTPYSGLTKALSKGLLPGMSGPVKGTILLPVSVMALVIGMLGFITLMDWWKYAGRREFFGISIPFPHPLRFLSGISLAIIMGTTTLAFTLEGVSIVLVLVLLRGGVLIIAPLVDTIARRRVRWFSWAAMSISLTAVLLVLADAANYKLSVASVVIVGSYLMAYFIKFHLMTLLAKTDDKNETLRYFVEEQMVASPVLLLALGALAIIGRGEALIGLQLGFSTFLLSKVAVYGVMIGLFYAGLCVCTTLIFLDRRENTFCVPMHCGSSMLSGLAATYVLSLAYHQTPTSGAQLMSAGLIVMALAVLSPLHHFERFLRKVKSTVSNLSELLPGFAPSFEKPDSIPLSSLQTTMAENVQITKNESEGLDHFGKLRGAFLFVCSGNTSRSPIAAAIGNVEIAARLRIPFTALVASKLPAVSAGISVSVGAPMTGEAREALRILDVPAMSHSAQNLTVELADEAEKIFCMTEAHRNAVIDLIPAAAGKTECLDPEGDLEDPAGRGLAAYVTCATRINDLVRLRFDEIGLSGLTRSVQL
jgi:protein-tyrosine-phosphatase